MLEAGFSQIDITPSHFPVGTYMGTAEAALDPLGAQVAAVRNGGEILLIASINVVILDPDVIARLGQAVEAATGIPAARLMFSATHNHACPAVIDRPGFPRDEQYLDFMIGQVATAAQEAVANLAPAALGLGRTYEKRINFNRRFLKRDGSMVSQPTSMADILCNEGVVDPEVGVAAFRTPNGDLAGVIVNFACHAVHHMSQLSGGYPGVLAREISRLFGPQCVTVFLNGPCGNIIHANFEHRELSADKERCGAVLATDVQQAVTAIADYDNTAELAAVTTPMRAFYRDISDLREHLHDLDFFNPLGGVVKARWYERSLELLEKMTAKADGEDVFLQTFRLGDLTISAVPAEYFSHYALRVKSASPFPYSWLAAPANGWVGYIPNRGAFDRRGGHERATALWSKMAPDTGNRFCDAIIDQLQSLAQTPPGDGSNDANQHATP